MPALLTTLWCRTRKVFRLNVDSSVKFIHLTAVLFQLSVYAIGIDMNINIGWKVTSNGGISMKLVLQRQAIFPHGVSAGKSSDFMVHVGYIATNEFLS